MLILFLVLLRLIIKLASIEFTENNIISKNVISRKIEEIDYSDILEIHYTFGYKWGSTNSITYRSDNSKIKKLKLTSATSLEKYSEFVEWVRNKNSEIEFKFFPPESYLIERYNLKSN
jgi:hypothetical protein